MKVYVMTKFEPFGKEEYVDVKRSRKDAMKAFREMFPNMRGKIEDRSLSSDANNTYLLDIKEVELG